MNLETSYCVLGLATLAYLIYLNNYKIPKTTKKLERVIEFLKIHESESRKAGVPEEVMTERYYHLRFRIERFLYTHVSTSRFCMVAIFAANLCLTLFILRLGFIGDRDVAFYALICNIAATHFKGLYWDSELGYLFYRSREILGEHSPSF